MPADSRDRQGERRLPIPSPPRGGEGRGEGRPSAIASTRIDLGVGAWIDHVPDWLPPDDARALFSRLLTELAWEQRAIVVFGRPVLQPRLIAWAGALPYRYSGQTLEPRAFTPAVAALMDPVAARAGAAFNHVLVNRYRDGADHLGLHADAEPELGPDPVVATLSLGATRRFVVKPRRARVGPGRDYRLASGSLLVMGGSCQRHFVHGVPREAGARGERISLTFRQLLR